MENRKTQTRGDQTREALLAAALDTFGRDGFDAASTRCIADVAGVNQALIAYHFGGKQGLYLAVFESITEQASAQMQPLVESIDRRLADIRRSDPDHQRECVQHLDSLLSALIDLFGQPDAPAWVKLVMREQQDPTAAFDIFYGGAYSHMLAVLTRLVAVATGQPDEAEGPRLHALTLFGQILVFMVGRATASRLMGWDTLGRQELESVRRQVRLNLYAQFGGETTL